MAFYFWSCYYRLYHVYVGVFFLWTWYFAARANVQPAPIQDSGDGIWALSLRGYTIFLANRDATETAMWVETYADTDVAFDPVSGLAFYCIMGPKNECLLHKTSLDQCYDEEILSLDMQLVYGMVIDSSSRQLYLAAFDVPRIYKINVDTGQHEVLFEVVDENVQFLHLSGDKRYLYWVSHSFNDENFIRQGNVDGTGTPIDVLSRPSTISAFGVDNTDNRFYFNQGLSVYSTDLNGNDERLIFTEAVTVPPSVVREITIYGGHVYWGNDLGAFRRVSLTGNPSGNTIETLATLGNTDNLINQRFISPDEIAMSRSILSLASSKFIAYENELQLTIEVLRTGSLFRCSCVDVDITTGNRRLTRAAVQNTLNFAAEENSKSFTITWTDNEIPDAMDVVIAQLSVVSDDSIGAITTADIVIRDDDCGYFFADDVPSVNENAGFIDVVIMRTCTGDSLSETVVVDVTEISGSATAGTDFIPGLVEATFASGSDTAAVRVILANNLVPEDSELFSLELIMPENGRLNEPSTATVTILDYDNVYILKDNIYEVLESAGSLDITVQRIGNTEMPGSVRIAISTGDAESPVDFSVNSTFETIKFPSGVAQLFAQVIIADDAILEANETFEVFLHSPVDGSIDSRNRAMVTIIDNEAEVAMADSRFSCLESRECFVEVIRRGYLGQTTIAQVVTEDLSAFAGSDFTHVDTTLTFDPWVTDHKIPITLVDDDVKEAHANFIVIVNDVTGGLIGSPERANVALYDDDSELPMLVYSLERVSYNLKESEERVEIVILRDDSYLGQIGSVRIQAITAATSTANDVADFVDPNMVVEFSEGQSRQAVNIVITNDDVIEGIETFEVQLLDAVNGVLGDNRVATVTIEDDDALYFFDKTTYRVNEAFGEVEVIVHRDGYLVEAGHVVLRVTGGTATLSDDYIYTPQGRIIEFPPGQTSASVSIEIIDDNTVEIAESIELVLSGAQYGSLGNPASAVVYIEDNDISPIESTTVAPPGKQLGTTVVILIIVGIAVFLIVLLLLCCVCAALIYRGKPAEQPWPYSEPPQRQISDQQEYSKPYSPYNNFGHVVRRLSGRVVRKLSDRLYQSPYIDGMFSFAQSRNPSRPRGTNNPIFEDVYSISRRSPYADYRPNFVQQLALPQAPSGYPY